ncbi:GNAT family N-acetyltransferase [Thaumasiovibrio subtropicus]|uniref:GNAT family N-acetyltransferase n=1 Tax=Thaumasiovibrio subtropicus TaxID=1891207 RepID=UPI000B34EBFD|nr:GNAT family protein [Thaumasiovibrio subtropicus]
MQFQLIKSPQTLPNSHYRIRSLFSDDLDTLFRLLAQPSLHRFLPGYVCQPKRYNAYFSMLAIQNDQLAEKSVNGVPHCSWVILPPENTPNGACPVGVCTAVPPDFVVGVLEIGFFLDERHRGKKVTEEVLNWMIDTQLRATLIHKLSAETMSTNHASQRVLESIGMQLEVHQQDYYQIGKQYADKLTYGCLLRR